MQHSMIRNQRQPLTMEQIRHAAPSAFATRPYHAMSSAYAYVPTDAIIQGMMKAGFMPFQASQSRTRIQDKREFTKHMIRFRHADTQQALAVGDRFPEIVLINSHDGASAYKLMAGIFEMVCSNGLIVADSLLASVNIAHRGNVIDEITTGSVQIVDRMPEVIDCVKRWQSINLTSNQRYTLAEAAHYLRFADNEGNVNAMVKPDQLLQARRHADNRPDLWSTFNVVQENAIQGGLRGRSANNRRMRTRAVTGIDQDVKLNRALWMLGERMAALATA